VDGQIDIWTNRERNFSFVSKPTLENIQDFLSVTPCRLVNICRPFLETVTTGSPHNVASQNTRISSNTVTRTPNVCNMCWNMYGSCVCVRACMRVCAFIVLGRGHFLHGQLNGFCIIVSCVC